MFHHLKAQPADPLLSLIQLFKADPRNHKIDLGVGVYRDAAGKTPVMHAVKEAEARLLKDQPTKAYLGPAGDLGFVDAIANLTCGNQLDGRSWTGLQTPGGTGVLRLASGLIHSISPNATVWLGLPSWPIHAYILDSLGQPYDTYDHVFPNGSGFNLAAALVAAQRAKPGDVFLLHGCCHNPTGVDPDKQAWADLSAALRENDILPIIDLAYHGLGNGLDSDLVGLHQLLKDHDRLLLAYSCDKNFGLYRERTGALLAFGANDAEAETLKSNLAALARVNWSMPPDHGAAVARIILEAEDLQVAWRQELDQMRGRLLDLRGQIAAAGMVDTIGLEGVGKQRGMFSMLDLTSSQIETLREDFAIYMAGSGRINVAGFSEGQVASFLDALNALS